MSEKKKISADKKKASKLQDKSIKLMNESTEILPKIGQPAKRKSRNIKCHSPASTEKPSTSADNHQEENTSAVHTVHPSTSSRMSQPQKNNCENCKECICRAWRSNLTLEFAALFGLQLDGMNKYLSKKNSLANQGLKIELFPNTGIFVTGDNLNLALSKANFKHREMVRQLLSMIVTDQELAEFKTAENMNKFNANIRNAIIGYLRNEWKVSLSTTEFNDIVRRRIELAIRNQKPPEELQKIKNQSIERAARSREKRKLLQKTDKADLKKKKACIVMMKHCQDLSDSEDDKNETAVDSSDSEKSQNFNDI